MDEFEKEWESEIVERLDEIVKMLEDDPSLQTEFILGAYAVFLDELRRLHLIEELTYLFYLSVIHPSYYKELIEHDESTQKMLLRAEYEARTFGSDCGLLSKNKTANRLSYHGG